MNDENKVTSNSQRPVEASKTNSQDTKQEQINTQDTKQERINTQDTKQEQTNTQSPANKNVKGVVVNCVLLNVRETPSINGTIKCTITKGTKVTIDEAKSTAEFDSIVTIDGITGFCMREFIKEY